MLTPTPSTSCARRSARRSRRGSPLPTSTRRLRGGGAKAGPDPRTACTPNSWRGSGCAGPSKILSGSRRARTLSGATDANCSRTAATFSRITTASSSASRWRSGQRGGGRRLAMSSSRACTPQAEAMSQPSGPKRPHAHDDRAPPPAAAEMPHEMTSSASAAIAVVCVSIVTIQPAAGSEVRRG